MQGHIEPPKVGRLASINDCVCMGIVVSLHACG